MQRCRLRLRLQSLDRDAGRRDRQPELVASVVHAVQREGIGAIRQRRDLDVQPTFAQAQPTISEDHGLQEAAGAGDELASRAAADG